MGKRIENTTIPNNITPKLLEATSALADNLVQSEPFLHLQDADRQLHSNQEAIQLLAEFSELQKKMRSQSTTSKATELDIKRLREVQSLISNNEAIQYHALTQRLAVSYLQEVNQEISQLLGIDFASLIRRSSGCC